MVKSTKCIKEVYFSLGPAAVRSSNWHFCIIDMVMAYFFFQKHPFVCACSCVLQEKVWEGIKYYKFIIFLPWTSFNDIFFLHFWHVIVLEPHSDSCIDIFPNSKSLAILDCSPAGTRRWQNRQIITRFGQSTSRCLRYWFNGSSEPHSQVIGECSNKTCFPIVFGSPTYIKVD